MSGTDPPGTTYYAWDGLNITHAHDGAGPATRRYTHGHTPIEGAWGPTTRACSRKLVPSFGL